MRVRIQYCVPCGYRVRAERLAALIRERLGHDVELVGGNFGVFKVWVDERLVFDKRSTRGLLGKLGFGSIPTEYELLQRVTDPVR